MDVINDSSVEDLQYTDMCNLVKNNNAITADCNNQRSPTSSIISTLSSASSSRTQRNKKKREASPETSNARIDFWKTASQALINISNDDDNAQDGIRHPIFGK